MEVVGIYMFKVFLNFVYFFLKLFPTNKKKIVFLSRQSDKMTIDFRLLREELFRRDKQLKIVVLCRRLRKGLFNHMLYFFHILRQMFHLATSRLVIIDSYCIPVCILHHKKSLFVLQIWHSIGKIKKSGYQTLDAPSGRSSKIAKLMCMHKNYDKIITGSKAFDAAYEASFNVTKDKFLHYGLPRIDYLINNEKNLRKKIYKKYPEFKNKKIVYYVPTFRTYDAVSVKQLIENYHQEDFVLIIHNHPNQKLEINNPNIYTCPEFKSGDLLAISNYVITDYSSICLDAAVLNKKVLFYVGDYEEYLKQNGMNLDVLKEYPTLAFKNFEEVFKVIKTNKYDNKAYQQFRCQYLPTNLGNSTRLIADYIMKQVI